MCGLGRNLPIALLRPLEGCFGGVLSIEWTLLLYVG
jgi:hypothetical protein